MLTLLKLQLKHLRLEIFLTFFLGLGVFEDHFLINISLIKKSRVVPDLVLFFKKPLYQVKPSGLRLSFNIFR